MEKLEPDWLLGCRLRPCWFEPTFQKHAGQLCAGVQIHVDDPIYGHVRFRPWRLQALAFKALWREFAYEYERDRLAIDLISGSELLRQWVDDPRALPGDLDALAQRDESDWVSARKDALLY